MPSRSISLRLRALVGTLACALTVTVMPAAHSQTLCDADDVLFRVGVLYHNTAARKRVFEGVTEALADSPLPICVRAMPYTNPNQGLELLRDAIRNESVDLIIGPTESTIFVRALEEHETLDEFRVPVVSPLVTAEEGNDPTGWFFRTNVGVSRRVHFAFDYLNKLWVRNIGVIYADTEYGRRAEEAFRDEVLDRFGSTDTYIAVSYEPPPPEPEPRRELGKLLDQRPEAIGIFGERVDIPVIERELTQKAQGQAPFYKPLLFTILDATQIRGQLSSDMYYVSVTDPVHMPTTANPDGEFDDVKALAHDTMAFITDVIRELESRLAQGIERRRDREARRHYRERFRNQFCAVMDSGPGRVGPKTSMTFTEFSNESNLRLYKLSGGHIEEVPLIARTSIYSLFLAKLGRIKQRFSFYPIVAILALLIAVIINVTWDLVRWYEGRWYTVLTFGRTYALIAINFLFGLVIFIALSEAGKIRYDSWEVAGVIGFVPSQFLRLKFFETRTGQSVGIVAFYDWILNRLNAGMMVTKFKNLQDQIETVAHYNSEAGMRSELRALFANNRNRVQSQRLNEDLERDLQQEKSSWARRKRCARELLKRLDWEQLQHRRLVPASLKNGDTLKGPLSWVRESKRYIRSLPRGIEMLEAEVANALHNADEQTRAYYERKVNEADTEDDKIFAQIRFLVLNLGYTQEKLHDQGLHS